MAKHIIVFSHGFGVRKDDKGLLTDIADSLLESESLLFDYNEVNDEEKTITMRTLSKQTRMLSDHIAEVSAANPEAIIDLICHSQGCAIAAFSRPSGIRKMLLLTPPFDMTIERTLRRYQNSQEADIDLNGISEIPPVEGYRRFVPAEYWSERKEMDMFTLYNRLAEKSEVIVIIANQDQVLEPVELTDLDQNIKVIALDGDHNFIENARKPLIAVVVDSLKV